MGNPNAKHSFKPDNHGYLSQPVTLQLSKSYFYNIQIRHMSGDLTKKVQSEFKDAGQTVTNVHHHKEHYVC